MPYRRHPNRGEALRDGWDAESVERKVFRHSHDGPETTGPPRAKKNTKKWCKGKHGVHHVLASRTKVWYGRVIWYEHACKNCGKVLDTWYPRLWMKDPPSKPDWVKLHRG